MYYTILEHAEFNCHKKNAKKIILLAVISIWKLKVAIPAIFSWIIG